MTSLPDGLLERVSPIVARALGKRNGLADHRPADAWLKEAAFASRTALEASHHAELVEALRSVEQEADQTLRCLGEDSDVEAVLCTIASIAARVLAKIGGDA